MYLTPQTTTALKNMQYGKITHALELAKIGGSLEALDSNITNGDFKILAVFDKSVTKQIPPFTQPFVLRSGEIVVDLRMYWSQISHSIELGKEISGGPAKTMIDYSKLMSLWLQSDATRNRLLTLGNLPIHTYSYWVGESISRTISADPITQREIVELAAWFYYCSFKSESEQFSEEYIYRLSQKIAEISWGNIETIAAMINKVGYLKDLHAFSNAVVGLQSLRTDKVNVGLIVTALIGSWFGSSNAKEVAAVAIEYPPAFLAMLHSACTDSFFRKSPLFDIAKRIDKQGKFAEFSRVYSKVLHG